MPEPQSLWVFGAEETAVGCEDKYRLRYHSEGPGTLRLESDFGKCVRARTQAQTGRQLERVGIPTVRTVSACVRAACCCSYHLDCCDTVSHSSKPESLSPGKMRHCLSVCSRSGPRSPA
eukprot:1727528-Rhodomonas_salina.2